MHSVVKCTLVTTGGNSDESDYQQISTPEESDGDYDEDFDAEGMFSIKVMYVCAVLSHMFRRYDI